MQLSVASRGLDPTCPWPNGSGNQARTTRASPMALSLSPSEDQIPITFFASVIFATFARLLFFFCARVPRGKLIKVRGEVSERWRNCVYSAVERRNNALCCLILVSWLIVGRGLGLCNTLNEKVVNKYVGVVLFCCVGGDLTGFVGIRIQRNEFG